MASLFHAAPARRLSRLTAKLAPPLLLALLLSGCAAQLAYRDGEQLVAKNQVEAGLVKLQEAVARDPTNAEYGIAYARARERAAIAWLKQAEAQQAAGAADAAAAGYQRVLLIDPSNERARTGLRALDADARHEKLFASAQSALERKDADGARRTLDAILVEQPGNERARAMLRGVAEKFPPAPPPETALAQMYRKPISIEFKEAPLRQVFEVISHTSGLNFVFDKDVKTDQKTSIFLKNSTIEAALYYLMVTNQLEQQVVDGNTVLIYPNIAAKLKEYQEMVVKTFFLSNADAKSIANTFKTILKSRDVIVDEKLNAVILRDSPEAVRLAEKLVAVQDVAEPEVMLDVEILEVTRSRLTDLGITWPANVSLTPLASVSGAGLTLADLRTMNRKTVGIANLTATINANTTDNDSNILANPRIRVRNHEKAKILIGDKVPNITATIAPGAAGSYSSESVSYIDVGLTLNVEPTIYLNNEVAIKISLEVSNLVSQIKTASGTVAYQIGTRQASTLLQLKDGENQVLAGLINNQEHSSGNKLPGIGDLPILGRLFGSESNNHEKTEIVLSITPHLVRNIVRPEASASEFGAGTEASFRRRPDASPRTLVALPSAMPAAPPSSALAPQAMPAPALVPMAAPPSSALAPQAMPAPALVPMAVPAPAPLPGRAPVVLPVAAPEPVAPMPVPQTPVTTTMDPPLR